MSAGPSSVIATSRRSTRTRRQSAGVDRRRCRGHGPPCRHGHLQRRAPLRLLPPDLVQRGLDRALGRVVVVGGVGRGQRARRRPDRPPARRRRDRRGGSGRTGPARRRTHPAGTAADGCRPRSPADEWPGRPAAWRHQIGGDHPGAGGLGRREPTPVPLPRSRTSRPASGTRAEGDEQLGQALIDAGRAVRPRRGAGRVRRAHGRHRNAAPSRARSHHQPSSASSPSAFSQPNSTRAPRRHTASCRSHHGSVSMP